MAYDSYTGFPAATAATLIGDTLAPTVVNSSLTAVGNLTVGVWNATAVEDDKIASSAYWNAKQYPLVSGVNLKTINGITLLGAGDISFKQAGGQIQYPYPVDGEVEQLSYAIYGFTIDKIWNIRVSSGSLTFSITINDIPITGLSNLSITTIPQNFTATALKTVAVGDVVKYVYSDCLNPTGLLGTVESVRT